MLVRHILFLILLVLSTTHPTAKAGDFDLASQTGEIRKRAEFWLQVYTALGTDEGVIHDAQYPYIVFEKVNLKKRGAHNYVERRKKHYSNLLVQISKRQNDRSVASLSNEAKQLHEKYAAIDGPNKFFAAAHHKRIRFQKGQKQAFMRGIESSKRYLKEMERIFDERGLPKELTRLPFVESSFNLNARSKVGASGIWQFMPSTGKLYLRIDSTVDERNDPIRATQAAAELLSANYNTLGDWSLAVTAYNHGRKALLRALHKYNVHTLNELLKVYRARSFGFASSNFFPELVAAIEAEKNADKYFFALDQEFRLDQKYSHR